MIVKVQIRDIPPDLLSGNYSEDEKYRAAFKEWVNTIWQEKEALLNHHMQKRHRQ